MGCIYMYTNNINGKKYIGQTIRSLKERHKQHLFQKGSYFDRALLKYGENNFTLEILEDNITSKEELNRLEIYYIKKYNTFYNGYNLTIGGCGSRVIEDKIIVEIIKTIKKTKLTFKEISEKFKVSTDFVSDINNGHIFSNTNEKYPIRKHKCTQLYFDKDIFNVIDLIINSKKTFNEISEECNVSFSFVHDVNRGKVSFSEKNKYNFPLRKGVYRPIISKDLAIRIIEELKKNNKSAEEIGAIFNIPAYTVGGINKGKLSICNEINEDFPIRKKYYRNRENFSGRKLNDDDLFEIIDLLIFTTISTEEISQRKNIGKSEIDRINQGKIFKKITNKFKLPIRQNKDKNKDIFCGMKE